MSKKDDIVEQIHKLDGENLSMVFVEMPTGELTIVGAKDNRVRVSFYGYVEGQERAGYLVDNDPASRPKGKLGISVTYPENDELEYIPIEETVSLPQAIEIVEYFIDHNALLPSAKWERRRHKPNWLSWSAEIS
jgi:hypothetical protein